MQIRSKECSARDLIAYTIQAADVIAAAGKSKSVALLVDDRLDVALAAREAGAKVDGVHVGQTDIPVEVCRKLLGPNSIVGLSAQMCIRDRAATPPLTPISTVFCSAVSIKFAPSAIKGTKKRCRYCTAAHEILCWGIG